MTDEELLILTAKAAGYLEMATVQDDYGFIALAVMDADIGWTGKYWNPLTDDGDALRLAVKLRLSVVFGANYVIVSGVQNPTVNNSDDPYAATRRAIVRAAAEIGKEEV